MEKQSEYVMCIIAAPEEIAEAVAVQIITKRLAACAQVSSKIKSFYWWNDKVNADPEHLIYLKTVKSKIPEINRLIREIHPYDIPEFIVLPIIAGNPDYFNWIDEIVN